VLLLEKEVIQELFALVRVFTIMIDVGQLCLGECLILISVELHQPGSWIDLQKRQWSLMSCLYLVVSFALLFVTHFRMFHFMLC
jgi:hypothetical protein